MTIQKAVSPLALVTILIVSRISLVKALTAIQSVLMAGVTIKRAFVESKYCKDLRCLLLLDVKIPLLQ